MEGHAIDSQPCFHQLKNEDDATIDGGGWKSDD